MLTKDVVSFEQLGPVVFLNDEALQMRGHIMFKAELTKITCISNYHQILPLI